MKLVGFQHQDRGHRRPDEETGAVSAGCRPMQGPVEESMLAAVFTGPRRIQMMEVPLPRPGAGQVRVRLLGCGLCASNLGPWQGAPWHRYPFAPGAPGHEGWGIVEEVGPGVRDIAPGRRVAMLSGNAYAQFDIVDRNVILQLPDELDSRPFPGEPLACAMNIFSRSRIVPGQTVAIVGIGFLGALLTQLCTHQGARVIAISRRPFALETARRCGAQVCLSSQDTEGAIRAVHELTAGKGCPRVIEAVGMQSALDLATRLTAERALLIIAGYHQDGPRQVDMQQWNWRGLDVINAHERETAVYMQGMRDAVTAVRTGRIDANLLLTHEFSLDALPRAFETLEERPEGFVKAWINPWQTQS